MSEKRFRFWLPIDKIEKAVNDKGEEIMRIGGIASTMRKDFDGQRLDFRGFDVSYLAERGVVNWNHSKNPEAVIGEPTKIEFRPEGLYVESELYADSDLAKEVYKLGKRFQKHSKTRRLGYSIEGACPKNADGTSPINIPKARITGLALTVNPKNADSIVNIIKGDFHDYSDDDAADQAQIADLNSLANGGSVTYLIDITRPDGTRMVVDKDYNLKIYKDLSCASSSGQAIMPSHVDGQLKNQLQKGLNWDETMENPKFFEFCCKHNQEDRDSGELHELTPKERNRLLDEWQKTGNQHKPYEQQTTYLSKSVVMGKIIDRCGVISMETVDKIYKSINPTEMENNLTNITEEMLEKALSILNPELASTPATPEAVAATATEEEQVKKGVNAEATTVEATATTEEATAAQPAPEFVTLQKSLEAQTQQFAQMGVLFKGINEKLNRTLQANEELTAKVVDLEKALDSTPVNGGRKSATSATSVKERTFNNNNAGEENIEKGIGGADANTLHAKSHKRQIVNIMDEMTFAKGIDNEMANAMTLFETSNTIAPNVVKRIQSERGITIVL